MFKKKTFKNLYVAKITSVSVKMMYLHRIMHDEVSETENIRKNLAIERMIVEGCEILLDTSQTFVRQGELPTHTHTHTHTHTEILLSALLKGATDPW